ncbi:hypothetical protein [Bradyrhizobium sp.]|uniref:hypothetical protein n=1 Tax=Bradyrhizobium sp. TaxID=376 RepID=UPI001D6B8735|nr:hypothetical protein [Bradyrhizobium sp.]MBI5320488.1 hypothetical protein [Bradyrhizobium sp.]
MAERNIRELAVLAMAGAFIAGAAHAAPQQALNKSVTVSFSITVPARGSDGSTQANPRAVTRTYYISSQGRVFARADRRVGKMQDRLEKGPGETNMRIAGNSMVGVIVFPSGAMQIAINFDPSFSSCSARAIVGAESGKPIVYKGLDGKTYTQTGPAQVSGVACSVSAGNAFAS